MSEKQRSQESVTVVRLVTAISDREPGSLSAKNVGQAPQSSGEAGEMCFGDEWLDDGEEELLLHRAMDALDDNRCQSADELSNSSSDKMKKNLVDLCESSTKCTKLEKNQGDSADGEQNQSCCCGNIIIKDHQQERVENSHSEMGNAESAGTSGSTEKCPTCRKTALKRTQSELNPSCGSSSDEISIQIMLWKKARTDLGKDATPLERYKGRYLWVSDLSSQAWCERQLLYDCTFEGPIEILETEAMKVGSEMHLKRELEVHSIKQIAAKTKEDKWAIKFLNILSAVSQLLQGGGGGAFRCVVREMPIFGSPFQSGVFMVGVIDEIRWNGCDKLELVEFKTRAKARSIPSAAQRKTHKLQVMVYKQLFDEAVCGFLRKETILEAIGLDPDATINDEIAAHARQMGLELAKLEDYISTTLERFQFLSKIDSLVVEYSSQDDREPFAVDEYTFDPVWLKDMLVHYNAFWEGKREAEGVDVEDAWKCNYCNYQEECDWRQKMHEKCLNRNSASRVKIQLTK